MKKGRNTQLQVTNLWQKRKEKWGQKKKERLKSANGIPCNRTAQTLGGEKKLIKFAFKCMIERNWGGRSNGGSIVMGSPLEYAKYIKIL